MLRARRPVPSGSDQSPYQSLMPLVLHTLGRLRSRGWPCVSVEHLDSWFNTHSHGDAVNGPPDAIVGDMATISRRFNPPATAISELVQIPFKPGSRVSFGETNCEMSAGSFESTDGFSPAVLSVKTLPVGLKSNGRFQCPDQISMS